MPSQIQVTIKFIINRVSDQLGEYHPITSTLNFVEEDLIKKVISVKHAPLKLYANLFEICFDGGTGFYNWPDHCVY